MSDSLEVVVGRIDGRTEQMLKHLETLNGRVGRAEARLDGLEGKRDQELGAQQERARWLNIAKKAPSHWKEAALAAGVVWTAARTLLGLPVTPQ
jgi:hypothetical protein